MTLAQLHEDLHIGHLSPDKVSIIYWYRIPGLSAQTFADAMRHRGFRLNRRAGGWLGTLGVDHPERGRDLSFLLTVIARRGRDRVGELVGLTISLNALRMLHYQETRDFGEERSSTGDNWVHQDAFDDTAPIWARLYEEAVTIAPQLDQFAYAIADRMRPPGSASLRDQRVSSIEICADIETHRPDAVFRQMLPRFKERFCRVRFQGYNTAVWYGELWHDCNSVRGYLSTGISFKLYVKTNRRLRLEVEYTREGLSRVRLPTDAPQIRPSGFGARGSWSAPIGVSTP